MSTRGFLAPYSIEPLPRPARDSTREGEDGQMLAQRIAARVAAPTTIDQTPADPAGDGPRKRQSRGPRDAPDDDGGVQRDD